MNVADLFKPDVVTIERQAELTQAARLMRERHVGYLVVVEPEVAHGLTKPVGVLTDRDIVVGAVAQERDPRALRVHDLMTPHPAVVAEADSIEMALHTMRRRGVRRLPVVGNAGQLLGVLSMDDVLDGIAREMSEVAGAIRTGQRVEGALRS